MAGIKELDPTFLRRSELVRQSPPNLSLLARPESKWTPMELLKEDRQGISEEASLLSNDLIVAVFYHGATEGALPSYLSRLQMYDATKDFSGTDESPWAVWDRGWTAEEHDHDLVHRDYLRLSGRVRLDLFDRETAYLIRRGFNTGVDDPLELICYSIWQELTTAAVHNNTADLALKQGARILSKTLKIVQGDEGRHAMAYMSVTDQILEFRDGPDELVIAFHNLLKKRPEMPTKNMTLFREYVEVVAYNRISPASTLVGIEEKMIDRFKIRTLRGLSQEAEDARDKLLVLHEKNAKRAVFLEERRLEGRVKKPDLSQFDWLIPQEA